MGVALPSTSSVMANEVKVSEFGVMSAAQLLADAGGRGRGHSGPRNRPTVARSPARPHARASPGRSLLATFHTSFVDRRLRGGRRSWSPATFIRSRTARLGPRSRTGVQPLVWSPMTLRYCRAASPFRTRGNRRASSCSTALPAIPPRCARSPSARRAGYSVELPRLPGHGTTVEDMMTTTWADWTKAPSRPTTSCAARCERVAVVGLSMGGGLAAYLAEERPAVVGCVLINPLVKPPAPEMSTASTRCSMRGSRPIESIGSDVKKEGVIESSYDATPLAPAKSLFEGVASRSREAGQITAPVLLLSSREDHVVTSDNGDDLVARVAGSDRTRLARELVPRRDDRQRPRARRVA